MLRLIQGYNLSFPIYLDMEDKVQAVLSDSERGNIASVFCNIIQNEGYKVGIYANKNWWTNYLTDSAFNNSLWYKWVAQYNSSCTYSGNYTMWQYTSSGYVNGINTNVDMNYWYGEYIDVNPVTVNTTVADSITESNATVRGTVAYSGQKPSEVGIYFGTSENGMSKVANDVINHNKNPFDMWYDLKDEAGLYLDSNTKYYWQCYAIVNGKEYKSFDDIKQLTDKTLNIKIVVKDFARNTTVKEFILNKDTGEVSELKPHTVTVTIQNGKEMSSTIVSEEDFILPVYKGELEKGYQFDGWEISGVEGKKDAGYVINVSKDTLIKPVFKKIEEKKEEENKPTFDVSKKKDNVQENHSHLDENYKKEDLQRENHSHKSDSTKDVKVTVPDENDKNFENKKKVYLNEPENIDNKHTNIDSKSTTNNDRLPKTGTVSEVFMSLVAGIMFTLGAFLGLKKKDQD